MKKLALTAMVATALFGSMNVVAEAATTKELRDQLISLGISQTSADNLVTYLSTIDLSSQDQAQIETLVQQAYDLIGDRQDLTTLSANEKQQLVSLANQAASKLGLVVSYTKLEAGNSITIVTTKGETLVSLDSKSLHNVLKNFDGDMVSFVETVMQSAIEVIESTTNGSTSVNPTPGNGLTDTGATLPTMMMAGASLVAVAAGLMVVSQRKMAE